MYDFSYSDYFVFHVHMEKEKKKFTKKKKRKVISGKSQNFIELLSTAQPPSRNEHFVSPSKNLLKNRN